MIYLNIKASTSHKLAAQKQIPPTTTIVEIKIDGYRVWPALQGKEVLETRSSELASELPKDKQPKYGGDGQELLEISS